MSFYLILHKVRGEPAFDIAERATIAGEPSWIISTSGHRAYPICDWRLFDIAEGIDKVWAHAEAVPGWDIVPDHYTINKPKAKPKEEIEEALLAGLSKEKVDVANIEALLKSLSEEEVDVAIDAILGSRK